MTLLLPLAVRVGDKLVTRKVDDVQMRWGLKGAAECSFQLAAPLQSRFPAFERVAVLDTRTGDVVWDGRLEDPGRSLSPSDGARWDTSAVGESARAADRSTPMIYIDQSLDRWVSSPFSAVSASMSATDDPGGSGADALVCQFNPGEPLDTLSTAAMKYRMPDGVFLGGFSYDWDSGFTGVSHEAQSVVSDPDTNPGGTTVRNNAFNTAGGTALGAGVISGYTGGQTILTLRQIRVSGGVTTVGAETNWVSFTNVYVRGTLYDQNGVSIPHPTEDYRQKWVYPSDIVADLVGRLLTTYDGSTAVIDTTDTTQIDQFAYPDGNTAEGILDDLIATFCPNSYYQVGATDPSTGKPSFTWRKWPTTIRYCVAVTEGLNLPGADAERFNRVTFRWTNARGKVRTKTYDAGTTIAGVAIPVVDELETAGPGYTRLIREPEIQDLADEVGSAANADQAAIKFLQASGTPPVSGTVDIARPIYDADQGRWIQPWEIRPGHLMLIGELVDGVDDLTSTDRNGRSVFRVVGVSYTASTGTAQVELDAPPRTDTNELAKQITKRPRKR